MMGQRWSTASTTAAYRGHQEVSCSIVAGTALDLAAQTGHVEVVQLLLEAGADMHAAARANEAPDCSLQPWMAS